MQKFVISTNLHSKLLPAKYWPRSILTPFTQNHDSNSITDAMKSFGSRIEIMCAHFLEFLYHEWNMGV